MTDDYSINPKISQLLEEVRDAVSEVSEQYFESHVHLTSSHANALSVDLYYAAEADVAGISIEGVDTDYWHTGEYKDMKLLVSCVAAALDGKWSRNKTWPWGTEEICFRVGKEWICTRTKNNGRFHYIKARRRLRNQE